MLRARLGKGRRTHRAADAGRGDFDQDIIGPDRLERRIGIEGVVDAEVLRSEGGSQSRRLGKESRQRERGGRDERAGRP